MTLRSTIHFNSFLPVDPCLTTLASIDTFFLHKKTTEKI